MNTGSSFLQAKSYFNRRLDILLRFYMLTGQKIRPEAWIDLDPGQQKLFNSTASGSGATLNSYYNNMTIIEN